MGILSIERVSGRPHMKWAESNGEGASMPRTPTVPPHRKLLLARRA